MITNQQRARRKLFVSLEEFIKGNPFDEEKMDTLEKVYGIPKVDVYETLYVIMQSSKFSLLDKILRDEYKRLREPDYQKIAKLLFTENEYIEYLREIQAKDFSDDAVDWIELYKERNRKNRIRHGILIFSLFCFLVLAGFISHQGISWIIDMEEKRNLHDFIESKILMDTYSSGGEIYCTQLTGGANGLFADTRQYERIIVSKNSGWVAKGNGFSNNATFVSLGKCRRFP